MSLLKKSNTISASGNEKESSTLLRVSVLIFLHIFQLQLSLFRDDVFKGQNWPESVVVVGKPSSRCPPPVAYPPYNKHHPPRSAAYMVQLASLVGVALPAQAPVHTQAHLQAHLRGINPVRAPLPHPVPILVPGRVPHRVALPAQPQCE